jgi:hypothetical protein
VLNDGLVEVTRPYDQATLNLLKGAPGALNPSACAAFSLMQPFQAAPGPYPDAADHPRRSCRSRWRRRRWRSS